MYKKIGLILVLAAVLISCDKRYTYVEIILEKELSGEIKNKEEMMHIIKAKNDTLAFLDAFERFCVFMKINKNMHDTLGFNGYNFKLINEKGEDIAYSILFATKEEKKDEILDRVFHDEK